MTFKYGTKGKRKSVSKTDSPSMKSESYFSHGMAHSHIDHDDHDHINEIIKIIVTMDYRIPKVLYKPLALIYT